MLTDDREAQAKFCYGRSFGQRNFVKSPKEEGALMCSDVVELRGRGYSVKIAVSDIATKWNPC